MRRRLGPRPRVLSELHRHQLAWRLELHEAATPAHATSREWRDRLLNTPIAVADLGSLGWVYAGLPVGMQETVRKLPDEAILLLATLISY
jgi:hypothetical protein